MSDIVSLKSLLVPSKQVEVEFPGFSGFKITLSFLSRETLVNIRKKATKTTFNNKARMPQDELDDKLFLKLYTAAAIKGWTGFKYEYLYKLAPSDIDPKDFEKTLPFTEENAIALMEASADFDGFISNTVSDLANFTKDSTAT